MTAGGTTSLLPSSSLPPPPPEKCSPSQRTRLRIRCYSACSHTLCTSYPHRHTLRETANLHKHRHSPTQTNVCTLLMSTASYIKKKLQKKKKDMATKKNKNSLSPSHPPILMTAWSGPFLRMKYQPLSANWLAQ